METMYINAAKVIHPSYDSTIFKSNEIIDISKQERVEDSHRINILCVLSVLL